MKIRKIKGVTIVEIMISLVIASLLMAGMVSMVASNSAIFRENEVVAESTENLRYSIDTLTRNITMAGFMGNTQPGNVVATADLKEKLNSLFNGDEPTRKYADPAEFGNFIWYGNLKDTGLKSFSTKNINGLVIKQAVAGNMDLNSDENDDPHRLYVLANPFTAKVYSSGAASKPTDSAVHQDATDTTTPLVMPVGSDIPGGKLYQYQTYIYTIENDATGTPSLIQYSLQPDVDASDVLKGFKFSGETLVENVAGFSMSFGVDVNGDSIMDEYLTAGEMVTSGSGGLTNYWPKVRSITLKVTADTSGSADQTLGTAVVLRNLAIQLGAGS